MKILKIEKTDSSLFVELNPEEHTLLFVGESRPEDCREFFLPILEWIDKYINLLYYIKGKSEENNITINVDFKLDYFNSTSAKYIMDILENIYTPFSSQKDINVHVKWFYRTIDEDMKESGEEYAKMIGANIQLIPY